VLHWWFCLIPISAQWLHWWIWLLYYWWWCEEVFSWRNISSRFGFQLNLEAFLSSWTISLFFSTSFGTNLDNVINWLISFCSSFIFKRLLLFVIALHFSRLTSMPRCVSMKPRIFLLRPWTHISRGLTSFCDFIVLWKLLASLIHIVHKSRISPWCHQHIPRNTGRASFWRSYPLTFGMWSQHFSNRMTLLCSKS